MYYGQFKLSAFIILQHHRKDPSLKSTLFLGTMFFLLPALAIPQQKVVPKTQKEKVSYSIGLDIGRNMKRQTLELDIAQFTRGVKDGLGDAKPLMTDQDIQECMSTFQKEVMARMEENSRILGEKNKKEGDAFLAENKNKPGVKTLPSGLQYKVLTEGTGKSPKSTDTVVTHYRGTFLDGKEFDSSYKSGEPATFPVNRVIPAWIEALQLMKEGSKWQLFVPSALGYGEQGYGQAIAPNATLIFEVELIKVK
jgi:FKBP-type peptidyl-prolyl cis-trans isomerase FklB